MSEYRSYPRRPRSGLALLSVLAAGLWACDASSPENSTIGSSAASPQSARDPAKKALIAFTLHPQNSSYSSIFVMTPEGRRLRQLTDTIDFDQSPAWSPDRTQIAFESPLTGSHIWVMNADGTNLRQLTNDPAGGEHAPDWSPDGTRIAFERNGAIIIVNADGTNPTSITNTDVEADAWPDWSPDGTKLAISRDVGFNQIEQVWVVSVDGSQATQITTGDLSNQNTVPQWSPDGSKIAFLTNRETQTQVYVMNADGSGQTRLTNELSSTGFFTWSPDGTQLAVAAQGDIWVLNADGTNPVRITDTPDDENTPAWAP